MPLVRRCVKSKITPSTQILFLNKPAGISSFKALSVIKKKFNTKKVGHTGTLDPFASGLLMVGINKGCKYLKYFIGLNKGYLATIRLGCFTDTDDLTGIALNSPNLPLLSALSDKMIKNTILSFKGPYNQIPSFVSAKRINGKRAYNLARDEAEKLLKPCLVEIFDIEILKITRGFPFVDIDIKIRVSSGTYIRALSRDIGDILGVGGHLVSLKRYCIGGIDISAAYSAKDILTSF